MFEFIYHNIIFHLDSVNVTNHLSDFCTEFNQFILSFRE